MLIPAEQVGAFVVALPKGSRSQHTRLLPYAVEDRIGQPIETMIVAPAPLAGAGPGQILACVVSFGALATAIEASRTGAAPAGALPEFLLILPRLLQWLNWLRPRICRSFAIFLDLLPIIDGIYHILLNKRNLFIVSLRRMCPLFGARFK